MAHPNLRRQLTEDEYLAFEETSSVKHELVDGEVYAMTGTTTRHNVIAMNVATRLRTLGRSQGCLTFMLDIKVRVPRGNHYYPDVIVVGEPVGPHELVLRAPCLLVEVTSPSTESTDRREKTAEYRSIPSLRAYLIVDQQHRHVTRHWRDDAGRWWGMELWGDDVVPVPCPGGVELTFDEIYEDA